MPERSTDVVVVGAGAAGLGAAVELRRLDVPSVVLESSDEVGGAWRHRYRGLHLNTVRVLSGVRGDPIPRVAGRWLEREDFLAYLEALPRRHGLEVRTGVGVERIDAESGDWRLETTGGQWRASAVVIATGYDRVPKPPGWERSDSFTGELLHSSEYREPESFRGRDVLVVGCGNSASEIATQLARGCARRVRLAVRTPPNLVPAEFLGLPATFGARLAETSPAPIVDRVGRLMQRAAYGDLSRHGLGRAPHGIATELQARGLGPVLERGFVAELQRGSIEVVAAVERCEGETMILADGSRIQPDTVIAATGFRHGLEEIVGHLGVLDEHGKPAVRDGGDDPRAPNLFFHGFWLPLAGQLPAMRRTGRRIARRIAHADATVEQRQRTGITARLRRR